MEPRAACMIILGTIIGVCLKLDAKLNVIPRDNVVKINESTYLNCSTSLEATEVQWLHGNYHVYAGRVILEPYNERFSVEISASTGACNLVIRLVQPSDAGTYECADDEGSGDRRSVQLIVLGTGPTCKSNIQSEGIIGPNSCEIRPDVVQLSCSATYHGNSDPILQWKRGETNESVADDLFDVTSINNEVTYRLTMNSTLDLNNASFICEATTASGRQFTCSSNISKIMYIFSSDITINMTVNDEVSCFANTSQSCSYKWKWFSGDDSTTESENQILKPKKAGWHRCESTCSFGNRSCTVVSMHANVSNNIKPDTASSRHNLLALLALLVLPVLFVAIWYCRKKQTEKSRNTEEVDLQQQRLLDGLPEKYKTDPTLIKTIIPEFAEHGKKQIRGLTILNGRLFVVSKWSPDVEVYDSITFYFSHRWNLKEIVRPQDIVSCNINQCLYINGYIDVGQNKILKIDPNGTLIRNWSTGDEFGLGLSVTGESNVILTVYNRNKLKEYSPEGLLFREINLSVAEIRSPYHALKLDNDHFLVSHSEIHGDVHRVCIVNADGNLEKSFDGKSESSIGNINNPSHMAVDGNGFLMVVDKYRPNGRILLLNPDLKFMRVLISNKRHKLQFPMRILLDELNGRMFVADNESDKAGQIFIFEFCAKEI